MNSKKKFEAPDGFDIAHVELTPEQKSWLAKARGAVGKVFSRKISVE